MDDPDGGTVLVEGRRISHRPESVRAGIRAQRIGVVAQSGNLFEHLTVEANVAFVQALTPNVAGASSRDLLRTVGLGTRAAAYPGELSGGEAARAALAVALANDPAVVLADEPTGELDTAAEADMLGLLIAAAGRGVAVVVASHSPAVAAVADRVVALYDGRVVA
jgi:putative ABC transport system ATP-binding protein